MLSRVILAVAWLALGAATAWAPEALAYFFADQLGVSLEFGAALTWGFVTLEIGLGLGLILSCRISWLKPLGVLSLLFSLGLLALVLLVEPLRTCNCFGALRATPFGHKLIVLGALVYLSVIAAWPRPEQAHPGESVQL